MNCEESVLLKEKWCFPRKILIQMCKTEQNGTVNFLRVAFCLIYLYCLGVSTRILNKWTNEWTNEWTNARNMLNNAPSLSFKDPSPVFSFLSLSNPKENWWMLFRNKRTKRLPVVDLLFHQLEKKDVSVQILVSTFQGSKAILTNKMKREIVSLL